MIGGLIQGLELILRTQTHFQGTHAASLISFHVNICIATAVIAGAVLGPVKVVHCSLWTGIDECTSAVLQLSATAVSAAVPPLQMHLSSNKMQSN